MATNAATNFIILITTRQVHVTTRFFLSLNNKQRTVGQSFFKISKMRSRVGFFFWEIEV